MPTCKVPILLLVLAIITASLTACSAGDPPTKSWELALTGNYSAALSNNGKQAIIGSINHGGSFWDIPKNKRLFDWNHKSGEYTNIIAAAISPGGHYGFTADHQTMVLWDAEKGDSLTFWIAPNEVLSVALTDKKPHGIYAALGLADHTAVLYNAGQGKVVQTFHHKNRVRSVALSRDGSILLTGSEDQTAKVWNVKNGRQLHSYQHDDEVRLVALSPTGDTAFSVSKYDIAVLWNAKTGKKIGDIPLSSAALKRGKTFSAAAFSSNGKQLLTGNADRIVQLWDVRSQKELARWEAPKRSAWKPTAAAILTVAFGGKGTYYAIASNGFAHEFKR